MADTTDVPLIPRGGGAFKPKGKPTVTILVGESGSGKSTLAKQMVKEDTSNYTVRINRDSIREMLAIENGPRALEGEVIKVQLCCIDQFILAGYNVIVDDTNLSPKTHDRMAKFAEGRGAKVVTHRMDTALSTCIRNDALRAARGERFVGRAVIERQFLVSRRIEIDPDMPIVIVDLDGTLANTSHRSPYDESQVILDDVYPEIVQWVRDLYYGVVCEGNPEGKKHIVLLVSGRHSTCGGPTATWLKLKDVPYHHLFMRHGWDNRKDTIVKQEILNELLGNVPKERIAFVIDDRPSVLNMWHSNGIKIYPAREIKEPF